MDCVLRGELCRVDTLYNLESLGGAQPLRGSKAVQGGFVWDIVENLSQAQGRQNAPERHISSSRATMPAAWAPCPACCPFLPFALGLLLPLMSRPSPVSLTWGSPHSAFLSTAWSTHVGVQVSCDFGVCVRMCSVFASVCMNVYVLDVHRESSTCHSSGVTPVVF